MATKSILKTIEIRDKSLAHLFSKALIAAESTTSKEVTLSRKCTELDSNLVKAFFEQNN